ncbi:MAG: hypothetical protein AAF639_22285 [Chloroflexota bacterium]
MSDDPSQNSEFYKQLASRLAGVVDIENDGKMEIFGFDYFAGNAAYSFGITIYSTANEHIYTVRGDGMHGEPYPDVHIPSGMPEIMRNWVYTKVNNLLDLDAPKTISQQEYLIWIQNNGKGFKEGEVILHKREGPLPSNSAIVCEIDEENYRWVSYYKSAVWGYDKRANKSFLLFVPEEYYFLYIRRMVSTKNYLWLGQQVFDKINLKFSQLEPNIYFDSQGIYLDGELIPFLGTIDIVKEFEEARECK